MPIDEITTLEGASKKTQELKSRVQTMIDQRDNNQAIAVDTLTEPESLVPDPPKPGVSQLDSSLPAMFQNVSREQARSNLLAATQEDLSDEKQAIREDENLYGLRDEDNAAYQMILKADLDYQDRIEDMEKNPDGKLRSALDGQILKEQREHARHKSRLSFDYFVANQAYSNAQSAVNARIQDLESERERQVNGWSMYLDFASDVLSDKEEMEANQAFEREMAKQSVQDQKELMYYQETLQKQFGGSGSSKPQLQNFGTAANPIWRQYNPTTGQWDDVSGLPTNGGSGGEFQLARSMGQIDLLDSLTSSSALDSSVGTSIFGRGAGNASGVVGRAFAGGLAGGTAGAVGGSIFPGVGTLFGGIGGAVLGGATAALQGAKDSKITGERQNLVASIRQMTDTLTLDTLIQAKERGATFGALSDTELGVLASSGTKISNWAVKDGDGNVLGYNASEDSFKKEIDKVKNFAKLDYVLKGGNPADVGVQILEDGTYWVNNSDGSFTQLR